jgi:hypothetical protein
MDCAASFFRVEYEDDTSLWNVEFLPDYAVSYSWGQCREKLDVSHTELEWNWATDTNRVKNHKTNVWYCCCSVGHVFTYRSISCCVHLIQSVVLELTTGRYWIRVRALEYGVYNTLCRLQYCWSNRPASVVWRCIGYKGNLFLEFG